MWSVRAYEEAVRQRLGEPRMPVVALHAMVARINNFIDKIKKAKAVPPKGTAAEHKPVVYPKPVAVHASLEDAQIAATLCTKCRWAKQDTKGCQACMGDYFQYVRLR